MSKCPTCGNPLRQLDGEDTAICRHCAMTSMFEDASVMEDSKDAHDYEIECEIGRGGDGVVYRGFDMGMGREVAIKLLNTLRASDGVIRRFRAEIETIASLDHPHIIPIYANGEMDGRPFYAMKYVKGGNLETNRQKFESPKEVVALMIKVTQAIQYAHECGVLHRDLKPSNILLDEKLEPYISDFGLAKRYGEETGLTVTGSVMGTPAYMSPEQARGCNSRITGASDLFSLGAILYFLLVGRSAFEGESSHVILRKVIEDEAKFPIKKSRLIDRDLETICLKCLNKDPLRRYGSVLALVEDLQRWERKEPVKARRISRAERMLRWMKRHPFPMAAFSIAFVSLLISLSLWRTMWIDRNEVEEFQEEAGKGDSEISVYVDTFEGSPAPGDLVSWTGASSTVSNLVFGETAFQSIQAAVNRIPEGGKIFLAAGTYEEGSAIIVNESHSFCGEGAGKTEISGAGRHRVMVIEEGQTGVTLENLSIIKGSTGDGVGVAGYGGGIYSKNGVELTLNHCVFSQNQAGNGGAVYTGHGGILEVNGCTFISNEVTAGGGALFNRTILRVINSTFSGNSARNGGAIDNSGTVLVMQSTFIGNRGDELGGAIYTNPAGDVVGVNSLFAGNQRGGDWGNVAVWGNFRGRGVNFFENVDIPPNGYREGVDLTFASGQKFSDLVGPLTVGNGNLPVHLLVAGSLAIDAGDHEEIFQEILTDQLGGNRVHGDSVDLGAVEVQK